MNIFDGLNSQQKEAITHTNGPLLIVAGAGTGKTTVITRKIAYLMREQGLKPDEILALTFTEKAATEMEERVDALLPFGYVDVWISTFHAFCEKVLRSHAIDIGLSNDFDLLNDIQQWMLVYHQFERFDLQYYKPRSKPTRVIYAFLKHFSRLKDEQITVKEYLDFASSLKIQSSNTDFIQAKDKEAKSQEIQRIKEIAHAYQTYQALLLEQNALDFGDLVMYTLELFKQRPNLLEHYRKKFKYILVDEFQDTNIAQYELIKMLTYPNNQVTVCGDDDQSIYKFRGASVSNVLQFKQDYPSSHHVVLNQNYRSAQGILDCAYQFIQHNNPDRLEFKEQINKQLHSNIDEKAHVSYIYAKTAQGEMNGVMKQIIALKEAHPERAWSDFAILARSNASASMFCAGLTSANIPFQFVSLSGLFQKPVILDIMAYLHVLHDIHDAPFLFRVLQMPMIHISEYDISKCTYYAKKKGLSLYDVFLNIDTVPQIKEETAKKISKLTSLIQKHQSIAREKTMSELFLRVLHDIGYLHYLTSDTKSSAIASISDQDPEFMTDSSADPRQIKLNEESISFLRQFYDHIKDLESNQHELRLHQFLEQYKLELEAGNDGDLQPDLEGPDTLKVMTIHSSKGLEFAFVFIVQLVDQRFPTIQRKDPIEIPTPLIKEVLPQGDAHLEEERRLMYVAMTRAKTHLFFTFASDYGGVRKKKPSRFLYEAGILSKDKVFHDEEQENIAIIAPVSNRNGKAIYMLPRWFSFTQLAAFNKCPLQYKYAHILKIPTFGKYVFSYGRSLHTALQKYMQIVIEKQQGLQSSLFDHASDSDNEKYPPLKVLYQVLEESWISEWYEHKKQENEMKEKAKESLKHFYQRTKSEQPLPLMVEQHFKLRIGPNTLMGSIDRVDQGVDGGVHIIDYKTGQSKADKKLDIEDKMQLLIYQMAAQEVLQMPVEKLTFYYLDDDSEVTFIGSEEELAEMKQVILEHVQKIHDSDFAPNPGFWCQFCDFSQICEHKSV